MAGAIDGVFREKISKYIVGLMESVEHTQGRESTAYRALYNQYVYSPQETEPTTETNSKHYEAFVQSDSVVKLPKGIERLYKRQLVVDLTMVCAAHCRYCLRAYYDTGQLTKAEIDEIVQYCAKDPYLKELLVTGGDPLIVPKLLKYFCSEIAEKAKNIKIIRMGTRLMVQAPEKVNPELYSFFSAYKEAMQFEMGLQVNHIVELTPEVLDVIRNLQASGVRFYSQNVLLKGVNDDRETLVDLYDTLRYLGVESHYLFHAIPMKGTAHLRTTLRDGLRLIQEVTCAGNISGRTKPTLAIMTDIGKVVLYDGTIAGPKDADGYYTINTYYRLEDRKAWNPGYQLPQSAWVNDQGYITVKYLDGPEG
jgi:lysine 2,3-aminomutase